MATPSRLKSSMHKYIFQPERKFKARYEGLLSLHSSSRVSSKQLEGKLRYSKAVGEVRYHSEHRYLYRLSCHTIQAREQRWIDIDHSTDTRSIKSHVHFDDDGVVG